MEPIETTTTLGALISAHPELAAELERRGLDYCCGGGQTLAAACAEKGLEASDVASQLGAAVVQGAPAAAWTSMGAAELVDHLVDTHHRYLWQELPRLTALMEKIVGVHGGRHPELIAVATCFEDISADLQPHLLKEERVLFPMIRELGAAATTGEPVPAFHCVTLTNPVAVMLREHDGVGELLEKLRALTNDYTVPGDGCASYAACYAGLEALEKDTHLHIHKENNVLFPLVLGMERELVQANR